MICSQAKLIVWLAFFSLRAWINLTQLLAQPSPVFLLPSRNAANTRFARGVLFKMKPQRQGPSSC
jgi:hypothetical protein